MVAWAKTGEAEIVRSNNDLEYILDVELIGLADAVTVGSTKEKNQI